MREEYSAVFLGTVESLDRVPADAEDGMCRSLVATLSVDKAYKGVTRKTVQVSTGCYSPACGYPFVAGRQYLVFAKGTGDKLSTSQCTPTDDMPYMSKVVEVLDAIAREERPRSEHP
jgi:hypothetical protein